MDINTFAVKFNKFLADEKIDFKLTPTGTTVVSPVVPPVAAPVAPVSMVFNGKYAKALELSLYGMTWQTSGKKPAWNKNPIRGDVFLDDGLKDAKRDLSGGVFDCGDHIIVAMASGFNCYQFAWSGIFYKEKLKASGNFAMLSNVVRHYCDWFLKIIEVDSTGRTFRMWQWISDNVLDHSCMLPAERQEAEFYRPKGLYRRAFAIGDGHEPVGEEPIFNVTSALFLSSLMFRGEDDKYADLLLTRAKSLFQFGEERRGSYTPHTKVYASSSKGDERYFALACAYFATKEQKYLDILNKEPKIYAGWMACVDNCSSMAVALLAYTTKDPVYVNNIKGWFESWVQGTAGVRKHPGSPLRSVADWGTIPQSSSAFGLAKWGYDFLDLKNDKYISESVAIANYVLGENSKKFSWLIGWGDNFPKKPHHRAAMGGRAQLTGLVAGGEKLSGEYNDREDEYVTNEFGASYQCSWVFFLASLL